MAALLFLADGSCQLANPFSDLDIPTIQKEPYTTYLQLHNPIDAAIERELGIVKYQEIVNRIGHRPLWSRLIFDKKMNHPILNRIGNEILQDAYGDIGEIYGPIIIAE